jgi:hypothetical protein
MIDETIKQIEARIQNTESLTPERRQELLSLVTKLKAEAGEFAKTHTEQAQSIVGFTQVSAHEATRAAQDPALLNLSTKAYASPWKNSRSPTQNSRRWSTPSAPPSQIAGFKEIARLEVTTKTQKLINRSGLFEFLSFG